jgi:plastocyanin
LSIHPWTVEVIMASLTPGSRAAINRVLTGIGVVNGLFAALLFCRLAFASSESVVKIDNFSFGPNPVTVAAGTTLVWQNADDIPHSVVAEDKAFRSKALDTDDHFSFVFNKPGEFVYFCGLHPFMKGTVIVTP